MLSPVTRETLRSTSSTEGEPPSRAASPSLAVRAALLLGALVLPLAATGCSERACFEWTEAEGVCPAQDEALVFFEEPFCQYSDIKTIDSEPEFDDGACCYAVTKRDSNDFFACEGSSGGVTVGGVGGSSSVGGAGGVGGGIGGAGGAGGGMGGSGGAGGSPPCNRCNAALVSGDSSNLCPGSDALFSEYMMCLCAGACSTQCEEFCMSGGPDKSMECAECEIDTTMNGCGTQFSACASDMQ